MTEYEVGDAVRISFESEMYQAGADLYVTVPGGPAIYLYDIGDERIEVIKRATPPEPTEPGTVVLTSTGTIYMLRGSRSCREWVCSLQDTENVSWEWLHRLGTSTPPEIVYTPGGEV